MHYSLELLEHAIHHPLYNYQPVDMKEYNINLDLYFTSATEIHAHTFTAHRFTWRKGNHIETKVWVTQGFDSRHCWDCIDHRSQLPNMIFQ